MKLYLSFIFLFVSHFVAVSQAYETTLATSYVIYKPTNGNYSFGSADRLFKDRDRLGGPMASYKWQIQTVSIKNCTDLQVLPPVETKFENGITAFVRPVTCNYFLERHNFRSPNKEIGYIMDHKLNGYISSNSKVEFWIFYPGWRTQFDVLGTNPKTGIKNVELSAK